MSSFHASHLGSFGAGLPVDLDGYCHTTIAGWMSAPVDLGGQSMTRAALRDWAREKAAESRAAVTAAERGLAEWRRGN